jgi:hypothetical protein
VVTAEKTAGMLPHAPHERWRAGPAKATALQLGSWIFVIIHETVVRSFVAVRTMSGADRAAAADETY